MLALFQDTMAWGNESCQTLSLLFSEVRDPGGQPPRTVKPPAPDVTYTSHLTRQGRTNENVEDLTGYSENWSFNSLTIQFHTLSGQSQCLVVLQRTFT
jgi:hypothetical protein